MTKQVTNYYVCSKCGQPCQVYQARSELRSRRLTWKSVCHKATVAVMVAED